MEKNKNILLTFDLEEFDLPLEYGCNISPLQQMKITNQGMEKVNELLDKYNIRATFFTTSFYASANPSIIFQLATRHEIASHSDNHSLFVFEDYERSKQILEEISRVQVKGFRKPLFGEVDYEELKRCGYLYDSSINPTFVLSDIIIFRNHVTLLLNLSLE